MMDELKGIIGSLEKKDGYVPRLLSVLKDYSTEIIQELSQEKPSVYGAIAGGQLLCIIGNYEKAESMFRIGLDDYETNVEDKGEYYRELLVSVIDMCDEFGLDAKEYEKKLADYGNQDDSQRQIVRLEAELECTTGDLEGAIRYTRQKQARLAQDMGRYESAIGYYTKANEVGSDDYVRNTLGIVDCYIGLDDSDSAREEFSKLGRKLMLGGLEKEFLDNFSDLLPYFSQLGLEKDLDIIAGFAKIQFNKRVVDGDVDGPANLLISYYSSKGEHEKACELIDLLSPSLLEKAAHYIRAGRDAISLLDSWDVREDEIYDVVGMYLQIAEVDKALDLIDRYCEDSKGRRIAGSLYDILEARQVQIDILKAVIGSDYAEKIRTLNDSTLDFQETFKNGSGFLKGMPR